MPTCLPDPRRALAHQLFDQLIDILLAPTPSPAAPPAAPPDTTPDLLTTREAATLCRDKTPGAIRKAVMDGRLVPAGQRGGSGPLVFERAAVEAFYRGQCPIDRSRASRPKPCAPGG